MSLLPLPDSTVPYTIDGKPTKEFYNWLKNVDAALRAHGITLTSLHVAEPPPEAAAKGGD